MLVVASILCSFLFVAVSSDAVCGHGQYYYAATNKCFTIPYKDGSSFADAQGTCQDCGGDLVSIHSNDENDFIANMQMSENVPYVWIGIVINVISTYNNQYQWTDGSVVNYTNFAHTAPMGSVNAYMMLGSWYPLSPGARYPPLCQRPGPAQNPTTPLPSNCPSGQVYSSDSNKCLQFNQAQIGFIAARSDCLKKGGDLVSIHSSVENQLIVDNAKNQGFSMYRIGLNRVLDPSTNFTWSDASPVDYQKWNSGVPGSCFEGAQDCVSVDPAQGQWFNCWPCTQLMPYVCEFPVSLVLQEQEVKENIKNTDHPKNVNTFL